MKLGHISICLIVLGILSAGCNPGPLMDPECIVTRNGQPVEGVIVHFVPDFGRPSWGKSDAAGKCRLSYDPQNNGLEADKTHRIWVEFGPTDPGQEMNPAGDTKKPKDQKLILEKFGNRHMPAIEMKLDRTQKVIEVKLD